MPTTTNLALRYPADADPPDGPDGLGDLAKDIDGYFGAWTAYTPAVTQTGAVTLSASDSASCEIGKLTEVRFNLTVSGAGTGASKITIAAPAASPSAQAGLLIVGGVTLEDVSATAKYKGLLAFDTSSTTNFVIILDGGLAGLATMTAGLAVGDLLRGWARYETT